MPIPPCSGRKDTRKRDIGRTPEPGKGASGGGALDKADLETGLFDAAGYLDSPEAAAGVPAAAVGTGEAAGIRQAFSALARGARNGRIGRGRRRRPPEAARDPVRDR